MDSAIDLTQEDFDNHPSITKISNLILPHGNNFKSRNRFNYLLIRLLIISFLFFFFFFFFEDFNRLLLDLEKTRHRYSVAIEAAMSTKLFFGFVAFSYMLWSITHEGMRP